MPTRERGLFFDVTVIRKKFEKNEKGEKKNQKIKREEKGEKCRNLG